MSERSVPSLGLQNGTVVVVPYDPRWAEEYSKAADELYDALEANIIAVHHVGSTAVPGLSAKPILDLLVSVSDLEQSLEIIPQIEALNYEFRPKEDIPDRHFLRRKHGGIRTHHLSLAEPTSHYHTVTLAFRDALRENAAMAREYSELKLELARRFPNDRPSYIEGKTAFVERVLRDTGF
ncbi:MAG TPA: GrpB family protein [Gemmatimonadaceae bacterium]|nr:GrpB family protein [Gemmatimonadaceae bacterium]